MEFEQCLCFVKIPFNASNSTRGKRAGIVSFPRGTEGVIAGFPLRQGEGVFHGLNGRARGDGYRYHDRGCEL